MSLRYIHLRYYDEPHEAPHPKGGFTIAFDASSEAVTYVVAKCADADHYNKSIGRAITEGRFAKGKGLVHFERNALAPLISQVVEHAVKNLRG